MKTALSMVALIVLLASGRQSSSVAAEGQVTTSAKSATQVYVRTDPQGAEVRLAGESKGRSPQLIFVPDGATTMTVEVELDGYGRQQRQVKIEGGRITRVEFKFDSGTQPLAKPGVAPEPQRHFVTLVVGKDRMTFQGKDTTWKELPGLIEKTPDRKHTVLSIARAPGEMTAQQWDEAMGRAIKLVERFGLEYLSQIGEHPLGYHAPETQAPPDHAGPPSFGPMVEQVLSEPEKGVAELLDLDTGRRARMKEFGRNDRETHAWVREQKVDVMGAVERGLPGVLLFDCAVYENPDISWEKITPQEVVEHRALNQNEPKPIIPLATQDPSKLPLICLFETREGTKGVLQLVGLSDDKQGVKIRYKLIRQAGPDAAAAPPDAEQAVRQIVYKFAKAAAADDKQTVAGLLHEKSQHLLQQTADMREIISAGMKPAEIGQVIIRGDRALAATKLTQLDHPQYPRPVCMVYILAKQGGGWVIRDVDLEDEHGLADEVRRLKADSGQEESGGTTLRAPAREQQARAQIQMLQHVLHLYRLDVGSCPTTGQNLKALQEQPADLPDSANWQGPYLKGPPPLDPWGRAYRYQSPGREGRGEFSVWSAGPDGVDATDDDIGNWAPKPEPVPPTPSEAGARPAKKVHLPDVDTAGADVALDLATGEVLKIQDPGDHVTQFSRLGKGDLFFDRVLACLRGATAKQWDGKRLVDVPAQDRHFDATAYKLPEIPCRLLITTAEKKHFDVTVLAVTDDGGIDLEYRLADPVVVPKGSDRDATAVSAKARGKAHLPNTEGGPRAETDDFRRMKCILDLAGGRMLAFPEEVVKDAGRSDQFFAQATEGDLLYADRSLFCMRGAKAMRWDGQRFTAMEEGDFAPSTRSVPPKLTRYELPAVPCRLLITTAEKKRFDVMIHAVSDDGGIDLEYGPADAAVVPRDPR